MVDLEQPFAADVLASSLRNPHRTKIVATLGPSCTDLTTLRELILAGVTVVRLNFSHGSHDDHRAIIASVRNVAASLGIHVAIMQDLPGPKVRVGLFEGATSVRLKAGDLFTLSTESVPGTARCVSVNYAGLASDVEIGRHIFLADGTIRLRVVDTTRTTVDTLVEVGGDLRGMQGVNYPDGTLALDTVTARDLEHLLFGIEQGVDWIAVSFVRTAADVLAFKTFMRERGADIPIIAKIEKHEALENFDEILAASDAIMVARGDLGIEIPLARVPNVQKDLIARANRASKPVITATQMLESMTTAPRPTRAEAADVANAILDGSDAIMLSGETARGEYPVEAVRTMATIAYEVERTYPHAALRARRMETAAPTVEMAIAESAASTTEALGVRAIVTGTQTGATARHIASFRPRSRVLAITACASVARKLGLVWGVETLVVPESAAPESFIIAAETSLLRHGIAHSGDLIAITTGAPIGHGRTNVLQLHAVA